MAAITEDYCDFGIAKLLKEKGFEGYSILTIYDENAANAYIKELQEKHLPYSSDDPKLKEFYYTQPTLQMAMKWLRIEHNIHIEPHIVKTRNSYGYMPNFIDLKKLKSYFPFDADEFDFNNADKYVCITYDKACEVAIKYCLEHIIPKSKI